MANAVPRGRQACADRSAASRSLRLRGAPPRASLRAGASVVRTASVGRLAPSEPTLKIVAFLIVLFGLLTAVYGSAAVVPKYVRVEHDWMASSSSSSSSVGASSAHADLEAQRYELRNRAQSYAMAAVAAAFVGIILGAIGRKRGGFPFAVIVVGAVLTFAGAGYMQAAGNIF